MDELRLEGVHDDGEHLVLSDSSGRRSLLAVDQQLRQAVQRARRAPARRLRQGADFGPRDIQARFRSGATLEEIVEESGWEPERVRRYEWPILAERGHMAREAQKVELGTRRTEGYRSAFEGTPLTLAQTLETRAPDLGIAATSFDWDAWQRPDLLWTVAVRFRLVDPAKAPQDLVDQQAMAQWVFNPANLSVTPEPGWAEHLTQAERPDRPLDGPFGQQRAQRAAQSPADPGSEDARQDGQASPAAADPTADDAAVPADSAAASARPVGGIGRRDDDDSRSTEELLEVLDARRGQRLGADEESDDQLAEILGRSMGHVDSRPRPVSAPDDAQLFQQPLQPGRSAEAGAEQSGPAQDAPEQEQAASRSASAAAADQDLTQQAPTQQGSGAQQVDQDRAPEPSEQAEATDPTHHHEATIHHLGRADAGADARAAQDTDVVEITDDDAATSSQGRPVEPTPLRGGQTSTGEAAPSGTGTDDTSKDRTATDSTVSDSTDSSGTGTDSTDTGGTGAGRGETDSNGTESTGADVAAEPEADRRPRPRGRVGSAKRTRSSVPSWDDIVFGAKND